MKTWILATGVVVIGAAVSVWFVGKNSLDVSNSVTVLEDSPLKGLSQNAPIQMAGKSTASDSNETVASDDFVTELIAKLRSSYSEKIHLVHIQASLITVKEFVWQRYPVEGDKKFSEIIAAAFPEFAGDIIALLNKLDIYNEWLIDSQTELLAMEPQIQQGTLWVKRREIFGTDAERIWAHELEGMSQQKTAMQQAIQTLDQAHEISMDEKLYQLQVAIDEQLEGTVQSGAITGAVISKVFFNLDSVQQELAAMDSEARQSQINDIRAQLGLNEEQIERLQQRDQERESRWENGLAYMAEREQLLASVDEYARDDALIELRERYFGQHAITIQREEASDFWRYKRRRIYGVN